MNCDNLINDQDVRHVHTCIYNIDVTFFFFFIRRYKQILFKTDTNK